MAAMTLTALQLVEAFVRDTFQVVIFIKEGENDKRLVWTSQLFTSRRAARRELVRLRRLLKAMHLWQFFQSHYIMSIEEVQQSRHR